MNFAQKKVLSIAAGIASIGFTIVSVCTATVAWFAINQNVTATGMSIRCADNEPPIDLTYDVLKFDDDTKLGTSYGQTPSAIELPEYDSYISKKNEYANVVLRIEADFTQGLDPDEYVAFDINCDADLFKTISETTYIDDQTSNVIQFKSVVYSYTVVNETTPPSEILTASITDAYSDTPAVNADARYKSATTYFDSLYASTVYVSPASRNSSKVSNKTVTLVPEIGSRVETIDSIVIYLEISYNFGLADNYVKTRYNTGSSTVDLIGDISSMSFYTTTTPASLDSITLSANSVSITAGNSTSVTSTSSGNVTWYSADDTGSVSLSNTSNTGATITGVSAGHAVVSATTGQASAFLDANVARAVVAAIQLDSHTLSGLAGNTALLTATPYNFSGTVTYSWESSSPSVATVSASGNPATITYVDTGETTITCTATDGTSTAYSTCAVSVTHPTVTLNHDTIQSSPSNVISLIATASNFSGSVTYTWSSSDTNVATVSSTTTASNSVTCQAIGTAVITVTATVTGTEETATATCTVNVVYFSLDHSTMVGVKGETGTLTATSAENTGLTGSVTYTWSTSNSSIATYSASSNSATITYVNYGSVTITCQATNGITTLSDTCDITIGELTLDQSTIYAASDAANGTLTATLNGISGTATYGFTSGTTATATVTNTDNVATIDYLAAGSTVITCTATYSGVTFTATCTVYVASASLDYTSLSGTVGNTGTTTATASGFTGTVAYSVVSSNTSVATASMSSNVCTVTYVAEGSATVTITVYDEHVSTTVICSVTVTSSAPDIIDTINMINFAGTGTTSTAYVEEEVTDSTTYDITLIANNFVPKYAQLRGNKTGTVNFYIGNTTTRSGYYVKSVTITRSSGSGSLTTNASRTLINWGTSSISTSTTTGTAADTIGSGLTTVTWSNSNTSYNYFLVCNIYTSGSFYAANGITITWGAI